MSVGAGRVCVGGEGSVLDICYSYLSQVGIPLCLQCLVSRIGCWIQSRSYRGRYVGREVDGFVLEVEYGGERDFFISQEVLRDLMSNEVW